MVPKCQCWLAFAGALLWGGAHRPVPLRVCNKMANGQWPVSVVLIVCVVKDTFLSFCSALLAGERSGPICLAVISLFDWFLTSSVSQLWFENLHNSRSQDTATFCGSMGAHKGLVSLSHRLRQSLQESCPPLMVFLGSWVLKSQPPLICLVHLSSRTTYPSVPCSCYILFFLLIGSGPRLPDRRGNKRAEDVTEWLQGS